MPQPTFRSMQELQDLIRKLLVLSPARRLGVLKSGAAGVREHPWFAGFDWSAFAERQMPAPYIPKVRLHTRIHGDAFRHEQINIIGNHDVIALH